MFCEAVESIEPISPAELRRTCLCIGDVRVALCGHQHTEFNPELQRFRVPDHRADIQITVRWTDQLKASPGSPIFDSGAVWKLFRESGEFIFDFASEAVGPAPYKRMRTRDFTSAQLTLNSNLLPEDAWPLEYPADELLITNYLAHHGLGVEVHGCGLIDAETGGHLFLGHSGAGKSTTTRLWKSSRTPEILSDDRIILRLHDGELWMYGTPWHGEAAFASPGKAKLNRIHILRHGTQNRFTSLPQARAVGEVFARSFPPFHSPVGVEG